VISRLQIEGLVVSIVVAIGGLATSGCGSSEKKSESSSSNVEPLDQDDEGPTRRRSRVPGMDDDDDDDDDDVSIEGLKGHLAPYDIQVGMEGHSTALATCFQVEAKRKKFLGGQVELSFTIARDGTVKSVRATKSSVGSWPVEKCLLAESQRMTFKKPKGGEADFSVPLDFEARRVTNWWTEEKAESAIGSLAKGLSSCAGEASAEPRNVWVTLYLGNRGVVESVGFASPHKDGIDTGWADCAQTQVSAWTLVDPLGKIAKLGFRYNPE
tara:strand:- start:35757 stop:36563 length:807 start_codon:yes stop_codon:yes gene_type:complete